MLHLFIFIYLYYITDHRKFNNLNREVVELLPEFIKNPLYYTHHSKDSGRKNRYIRTTRMVYGPLRIDTDEPNHGMKKEFNISNVVK